MAPVIFPFCAINTVPSFWFLWSACSQHIPEGQSPFIISLARPPPPHPIVISAQHFPLSDFRKRALNREITLTRLAFFQIFPLLLRKAVKSTLFTAIIFTWWCVGYYVRSLSVLDKCPNNNIRKWIHSALVWKVLYTVLCVEEKRSCLNPIGDIFTCCPCVYLWDLYMLFLCLSVRSLHAVLVLICNISTCSRCAYLWDLYKLLQCLSVRSLHAPAVLICEIFTCSRCAYL